MKYPSPGHHRSAQEFRAHLQAIDPAFDCDDELLGQGGPLGQPLQVHGRTLQNRFATHPMEGWDGTDDGLPTEHTLRRWRNFGRSGCKLIWGGEAFAVQRDGRANPQQLYLEPTAHTEDGLRQLLVELRDGHREIGEDPGSLYVGLQLTHSGRFARPDGALAPRIAHHHPLLAEKYGLPADLPVLTDGELEAIGERFVTAAQLAQGVGFDFVDVKCCHGYLLHELLGAKTRSGSYGGSFENRTRLFRRIVDDIRTACPGLEIGVRVSIADSWPFVPSPGTRVGAPMGREENDLDRFGFGVSNADPDEFDLSEPFLFLQLLQSLGIQLVNLTLGSPYWNPHLQRPAAYPPSDGYLPPRDPLVDVVRHLRTVRQCKAAFPDLLLVGTGYTYLQEYLPHVAQYEVGHGHVDLVGLGRMLLIYPELPHDVLQGKDLQRKRICRTFSDCTTAPRNGMVSGCYPLDPYYKALPEASELKAIKRGQSG